MAQSSTMSKTQKATGSLHRHGKAHDERHAKAKKLALSSSAQSAKDPGALAWLILTLFSAAGLIIFILSWASRQREGAQGLIPRGQEKASELAADQEFLGLKPAAPKPAYPGRGLEASAETTQSLASGQAQTAMLQGRAQALQKSILATFILGEGALGIEKALEKDTRLLGQMDNALSVDLFHFLNQSANRADALENYLNLIEELERRSAERQGELQAAILFLQGNAAAKETVIDSAEEAFFQQVQRFNGKEAQKQLDEFIAVQGTSAEIQAKLGTYQHLSSQYAYYQPRLETHLRAIRANRDALIAGVKVVEIEGMTLPLVLPER